VRSDGNQIVCFSDRLVAYHFHVFAELSRHFFEDLLSKVALLHALRKSHELHYVAFGDFSTLASEPLAVAVKLVHRAEVS